MANEQEAPAKSGGKGVIIILLVIMILLIVGVAIMAFMLLGADKDKPEHASEQIHAPVQGNIAAQFRQYEPPEPGAPPQYFAMEPFVVNFRGEGNARFLAVTLKFMTYYPQLVADMENYRPMLRNDITSLLRIQTYTDMSQNDGPDVLRAEILVTARAILEKRGIFPDLLEDVFFDRFVMQ